MRKESASRTNDNLVSESEIRVALLKKLHSETIDGSITEELRIERGGSRIDVAVIGAALVGYEIKSDFDSFVRLSNQIHAYNRVFDEINLVCGTTHAETAERIIPSWWGLWVADRNDEGSITLQLIRQAQQNPKQDSFSLASLLWREEAASVLCLEGISFPRKASSHQLWEAISESLSLSEIRDAVLQSLQKRQSYSELVVSTI